MENPNTIPERMREIEIFGVPALFTSKAIPPEAVYPGMFRYELQTGDGQHPIVWRRDRAANSWGLC